MPLVPEQARHRAADETAVPGDQNPHPAMIPRSPSRCIGSLADSRGLMAERNGTVLETRPQPMGRRRPPR